MRNVLETLEGGIFIVEKKISNLRILDDTRLFARSKEGLADILERIRVESRALGLKMNLSKSKSSVIRGRSQLQFTDRLFDLKWYMSLPTTNDTGTSEQEI